jgi:protein-S-isoprenylcysteine O-methyltransferase Ste14
MAYRFAAARRSVSPAHFSHLFPTVRSFFRVALATIAFAGVHSLLANRRVKARVHETIPGSRVLYRLAYNIQAVSTFAVLVGLIAREPKITLYRVRGLAAALMRAGQFSGIIFAVMAARATGIAKLAGVELFEPAAQGPELGDNGQLLARGPFTLVRHPLNLAPLVPFWLTPHMTSRRLAFNVMATLYLILGSMHEEVRLRAQYGELYEQYRRSGVPFYLPRLTALNPCKSPRAALHRSRHSRDTSPRN